MLSVVNFENSNGRTDVKRHNETNNLEAPLVQTFSMEMEKLISLIVDIGKQDNNNNK